MNLGETRSRPIDNCITPANKDDANIASCASQETP